VPFRTETWLVIDVSMQGLFPAQESRQEVHVRWRCLTRSRPAASLRSRARFSAAATGPRALRLHGPDCRLTIRHAGL
jgi:hypothetical protein